MTVNTLAPRILVVLAFVNLAFLFGEIALQVFGVMLR
jgi:hypothetical protein